MAQGTHILVGNKSHSRFENGYPVRLVPGTVFTPTPQELAAFPDRFEPIEPQLPTITESVKAGDQTGETSPVYDEFAGDPLGFVADKTVDQLVVLVEQGEIPIQELVEAELARDNPRVTLARRLTELNDG